MKKSIRLVVLAAVVNILASSPSSAGLREWTAAVLCGINGSYSTVFIEWWDEGHTDYLVTQCVSYFYDGFEF